MTEPKQKKKFSQKIEEEMTEEIHPLLDKIQKNIKKIGLIIGGIILIAASYNGYIYYQSATLKKAKSKLHQITNQNQAEEKIKALEEFLPQAPKEIKQAIYIELSKTCTKLGQYDKALTYWQKIAATTSDSNLGIVAKLGQAQIFNLQGKYEQSLDILDQLSQKAPQQYQRPINYQIAEAAEKSGQWEKAIQAYSNLKSQAQLTENRQNYFDFKISKLQDKIQKGNS